jgi:hypothetical protein
MSDSTVLSGEVDNRAALALNPRREQTFPALTAAEIARMRRFGEIRHYQDGEMLFESGKPGPGMFVVDRASSWPRSDSFRAGWRWSTATPKAMWKPC